MSRPPNLGLACGLLALAAAATPPAHPEAKERRERWTVKDLMVPTRDGVRLHTKVFVPSEQKEPLPFLMERTPYGTAGGAERLESGAGALVEEGYIFVIQDIRGKFGSEGAFVMQRPARAPGDAKAIDEGTDTYDTIQWLLGNVTPNNGRVGMFGVSYVGWTTIMGALEPHPALKAISPQASPADMWLGDDFHHNGAFRLSYGFEYAYSLESGTDLKDFAFDRYDTFGWYLALGTLANVNARLFKGKIPTWNDYVAHPDYDEFWKRQTMIPHIRDVKVPTLSVAGCWDQEDFYGPLAIYQALERHDAKGMNHLVVGPWNHGGWRGGPGDRLGPISFDSATGTTYFPGGSQWSTWLVQDQRFVDRRPDVLSWETEPLEDDLTIAGEVTAHLFASTTGSDADWIVKLIDVYPERNPENWELAGFQLMVSNEVFRGRYRKSFEKPEPIPPGAVLDYSFSLHTQNYAFRKGHRLMVQVQSTWFPIIDRNPQTFVPNIFEAKEVDFRPATHRIHRSAEYPSRVSIPVVTRSRP